MSFVHEKSANFIFSQSVIDKLKTFNLTVELTYNTARDRQVFLIDVPDYIHNKDKREITAEIVRVTKKHIFKIDVFHGKHDVTRKYITITADSRSSREAIIAQGPLPLFGHRGVKVQHPIAKSQIGFNPRLYNRNLPGYDTGHPPPLIQ